MQHLELVSTLPALVLGYAVGHRPNSVAMWAWLVPTALLMYRMLTYDAPHSVLTGATMSGPQYYFQIARAVPILGGHLVGDPIRVWAQMTVTAPFYTGVAYSLSALAGKKRVVEALLTFDSPVDGPSASGPV